MKKLIFLFLISLPLFTFGQTKYEKEVRLKKHAVPQTAKDFINASPFTNKIKWYKEYGLEETSIEAKTKHNGKRYSIEFSPEGKLQDVEIKIKPKTMPPKTRSNMDTFLKSNYKKYKIKKVQVQYSGAEENVFYFLKNESGIKPIKINYEIVITAKVKRNFKKFEYLFSEQGGFIQFAEIVEKNTDNIEF